MKSIYRKICYGFFISGILLFLFPMLAGAARVTGDTPSASTVESQAAVSAAVPVETLEAQGKTSGSAATVPAPATAVKTPDSAAQQKATGTKTQPPAVSTPAQTSAVKAPAVPAASATSPQASTTGAPATAAKAAATTSGSSAKATVPAVQPAPTVPAKAAAAVPAAATVTPAVTSTTQTKTTKPVPRPSAPVAVPKVKGTQAVTPSTVQGAPAPLPTTRASGPAPFGIRTQAPPETFPEIKRPVSPAPPEQTSATPAHASKDTRYITIDFDGVDIQVFVKFISELTGKNFVIDDKVKGKVTVISPRKISVAEAYKVFESVLDVYGFVAIPAGDVIKILPSQQAREKNIETRLKEEAISPEDKVVTQIVSLNHASPDEVKKVLDPLISKSSVILSYPPTGMVIITDLLSNIKRLLEIVRAIDVDGVGEQISYIPLKSASASDMAKSLTTIFQQQAGKGAIAQIKIVADERANAIIISATENDTKKVRELLTFMDKEIPKGSGAVRVYYLQNAKAEDLAKVLTTLPQQTKTGDGKEAAAFSKKIQIVADKSTNALVITAEQADYLIIEDVIRKLDISRPMVYLEALIMEVNVSKGFQLGVEWQFANSGSYGDTTGAVIGGMSGSKGSYSTASSLASGSGLTSGLTLGVVGQAISVAIGGTTISFPSLAAFIQAYQSDTDVRIISTPQLLTLDNEEAEITVGSNVPYVTRQDTTTTSTTNYSSYEYKDVGVTLKVTPQINKGGFIRMKIDQSLTKMVSASATVSTDTEILTPTTLKRTAKTTVTIKDGDTVVIGGMIEDNSDNGDYKVPLLGDIPLLGWLFKSRSKSSERNNLFIFITPRIIRAPEDASAIHTDKKDYMRALQEGTIKPEPAGKKDKKEKQEKQDVKEKK